MKKPALCCLLLAVLCLRAVGEPMSERLTKLHGYDDCILLKNRNTRVILSGACGGRVLEYSLDGVNALLTDPAQDGWTYTPGGPMIDPCAGRMDIGPENTLAKHPDLWLGRWKMERTGSYSARMTSVEDKVTGVQLIRDFRLSKNSSKLTVTQTMRNVSRKVVRVFHWGRTFAPSGGICIVPLGPASPFPQKYVMWQRGSALSYFTQDKRLTCSGDTLFVTGVPRHAKIGITSSGKVGYLTPNNLLFTKEFAVDPDRIYGDLVAMNFCVCYSKKFCEIEPIGPQECLAPGESASYTETWALASTPFPASRQLDFGELRRLVK